jgi:hypothetical protein
MSAGNGSRAGEAEDGAVGGAGVFGGGLVAAVAQATDASAAKEPAAKRGERLGALLPS